MKHCFMFILLYLTLNSSLIAKTLIIGTVLYDPPYEMLANQGTKFFGFDIDIMNALCQQLAVKCQYKAMPFGQLFMEIEANTIDLALAGIIITSTRQEDYLFSLPYLASYARFITRNTSDINSLHDLKDKKIGILKSTSYTQLLEQMFGSNITVIEYSSIDEIINALGQHQIDAVVGAAVSVEYWFANNSAFVKMVGNRIPFGYGVAIMSGKNQAALINQVNKALEQIENNGIYLTIYERYFGKDPLKMGQSEFNRRFNDKHLSLSHSTSN